MLQEYCPFFPYYKKKKEKKKKGSLRLQRAACDFDESQDPERSAASVSMSVITEQLLSAVTHQAARARQKLVCGCVVPAEKHEITDQISHSPRCKPA